MSDQTASSWADQNARYLGSAIAWVRALLSARADSRATPAAADVPKDRQSWWSARRGAGLPMLAAASGEALRSPDAASQSMEAIEAEMSSPPALAVLAQRLGLTAFERNVLLLCAAIELDTSIAGLCAAVHSDPMRAYPSFALALDLFPDPAWDALSPERPLRHWRLLDVAEQGAMALTVSPLRAEERVINFIRGIAYLDERLTPLVTMLPDTTNDAAPSQQSAANEALRQLNALAQEPGGRIVQLVGSDPQSKQIVAGLIGHALNRSAWQLDPAMLPTAPADLELFVRLWERESLLLPVLLYIDLDGAEVHAATIDRLIARQPGLMLLAARALRPAGGSAPIVIEVDRPSGQEQQAIWASTLGGGNDATAAAMAGQFNLNGPAIRAIATREENGDAATLQDRLWNAARETTRPRLDALARRLQPKVNWSDLVLPAAELDLLHQVAAQVGHRGRVYRDWGFAGRLTRGLGLSVLFAGPPGAGKTLAAEVLANELKLDLFRIDLSGVVSRWLGETESNLRRLFDAAEDGGTILFFDEADALFGKRTEVKDSHDRYANIEINYLLQRMESFGGLAILATNMKASLDQAFLRRLRFVIDFPFPGIVERVAMWKRAFPPQTPVQGLDYDQLGKLNMTGGHITVTALNAAFQAAQARTPVTMEMVLTAARQEMRKLGRPMTEPAMRIAAS